MVEPGTHDGFKEIAPSGVAIVDDESLAVRLRFGGSHKNCIDQVINIDIVCESATVCDPGKAILAREFGGHSVKVFSTRPINA